ncbi:Protein STICHEL-like 1 [Raphanus sativus]|nr:Protein STICHEL-like 1 [Raphanus sativus]KAJ4906050.1 Protein STICHEL-like 1 [Raphanus sativus]KAJ4910494.1 Protein STICHEL-like 1 [Raphanus sativus]
MTKSSVLSRQRRHGSLLDNARRRSHGPLMCGSKALSLPSGMIVLGPSPSFCRSSCSPSFSDTPKRKRSSILCGGSQYRHIHSSGRCNNKLSVVPLLRYGGDSRGGSSLGIDDDLSTKFGEIDLESQSRLDGGRWSTSCKSQEEGSTPENMQSLSNKYRPMFFDELVGQSIAVPSLMNALKKGRAASVYLFQGPRGTGKTSTARIFSAALNCDVVAEEMKPCGYCKECSEFMAGKSRQFCVVKG